MSAAGRSVLRELVGRAPPGALTRAQDDFWAFCRLMDPNFFREDRPHLRILAQTLQALGEGALCDAESGRPQNKLMINLPPRMGKTYALTLFLQWLLGKNEREKIISVSYNEILAARGAKAVRDGIAATRACGARPVFSDVFPDVRVKGGDAAQQLWALEGQHFNFLAAGFGGTITGVGCTLGVIDDPIKNHLEAFNAQALDAMWAWYTDTFLSRIEEGGRQIVVMTRWAERDLCGRLLAAQPGMWRVLRLPALDEGTGEMLCPSLLSRARYEELSRLTGTAVMRANYQQEPVERRGLLYDHFSTYARLPERFERIISYTDTADTGRDFLCCVAAGVWRGQLYLLDVCYTDQPMEVTEGLVAALLHRCRVDEAAIESNNGGRGFARNVRELLYDRHGDRAVRVLALPQRANKEARMLVQAGFVEKNVLMPEDWGARWGAFYRAMNGFLRAGRNAHDDAPDAVTGLAEFFLRGGRTEFRSGAGRRA